MKLFKYFSKQARILRKSNNAYQDRLESYVYNRFKSFNRALREAAINNKKYLLLDSIILENKYFYSINKNNNSILDLEKEFLYRITMQNFKISLKLASRFDKKSKNKLKISWG